jgi:FAD/FMN-containing dehydrogenase
MRGGGGGNFGVVTSMRLRTFPVEEEMMMGETCWNWNTHGRQVFQWWAHQATSDATPREVTYSCRSHFGPLDQKEVAEGTPQEICIQPFYYGSAAEGERVVRGAFSQLPAPVSDYSKVQPWINDVELEHAKVTKLYGLNVYIHSGFFSEMPSELIDVLHAAVASAPSLGNCIIDFDHLHGAIADVEPSATAYVNRAAKTNIQIIATWENGDNGEAIYKQWADNLFARVAPYMTGNYVNYIDSSLPSWQQRYYGENYERLLSIKEEADPNHFFSFPQSIGA